MSLVRMFNLLIIKNKRLSLVVIIISVATIMSSVGLMTFSGYIISFCALQPSIADIMVAVVGVRFFGISRGVFRYLERLLSHNTTFRLLSRLRGFLYNKIEASNIATYLRMDKEDIFTRLVDDVEVLQEFYLRTFNPFIVAIITGLIGWLLLTTLGKSLGITFALLYIFAILVVPIIIWNFTKGIYKNMVLKISQIKIKKLDFISGMEDIFANTGVKTWKEGIQEELKQLYKIQNKMAMWSSIASVSTFFLSNIAMMICVVIAASLVRQNSLGGVYIAVVALGIIALFEAAIPIPALFQRLEQSKAAADRIFGVADNCSQNSKAYDYHSNLSVQGNSIQLQGVNFRYPNQISFALEGISFKINRGDKIGIVGPSGSGKSTLSYILLDWLRPEGGSIKFDNISTQELNRETIEKQFSVVNQQVYLFNATIKENILIGNPKASIEEIKRAVEIAGIKEFIEGLPQGYDTELGENGMKISGGQRQRLGIARALLKKSKFLILDEATAGMDMLTEKEFLRSLYKNVKDRGIIMITHRLVAMENMEEILVMDTGKIVERGTHEHLLRQRGLYFKMFNLQMQYLQK